MRLFGFRRKFIFGRCYNARHASCGISCDTGRGAYNTHFRAVTRQGHLLLLLFKIVIGITAGYIVDLFVKKHPEKEKHDIGDICKGEHCHCDEHKGIFVSALTHTLKVFGFLLVFTLALNFAIELLGADRLSEILLGNTFFQPLIAALIGLIPNCAASVLLTEMYLGGALSFASVIAGLCSGAGIGLMVLFRTNKKPRENLKILGLLYGISAFSGVIIEIFTKLMA